MGSPQENLDQLLVQRGYKYEKYTATEVLMNLGTLLPKPKETNHSSLFGKLLKHIAHPHIPHPHLPGHGHGHGQGQGQRQTSTKEKPKDSDIAKPKVSEYSMTWRKYLLPENLNQAKELLKTTGTSNIVNKIGDTLVHKASRRGNAPLQALLLSTGAEYNVCDLDGKTPLHDACWASNFHPDLLVNLLTKSPALIFAQDRHGAGPLSYIPESAWPEANAFLEKNADKFWPAGSTAPSVGSSATTSSKDSASPPVPP